MLRTTLRYYHSVSSVSVYWFKVKGHVHLQVVDFMVSLLQRACVGLDLASGPGLGNPVESQTLSMGMSLVATLLSGPQVLKGSSVGL